MCRAQQFYSTAHSPRPPAASPKHTHLNQKLSPAGTVVGLETLPNTHALARRDRGKPRGSVVGQGEPHELFRRSSPTKVGSSWGPPGHGLLAWRARDLTGGRGHAGTYSLRAEQERRAWGGSQRGAPDTQPLSSADAHVPGGTAQGEFGIASRCWRSRKLENRSVRRVHSVERTLGFGVRTHESPFRLCHSPAASQGQGTSRCGSVSPPGSSNSPVPPVYAPGSRLPLLVKQTPPMRTV